MNDKSDKSELNSAETRISAKICYHNAVDGPPICYPCDDNNLMSLHELITNDMNIMLDEIEAGNITDSNLESTLKLERHRTSSLQVKKEESNEWLFEDFRSKRADIHEVLKNIQCTMNQLKVTYSLLTSQISKDSEQIRCYLLKRDSNIQIQSKSSLTNCKNISEMQQLQAFLLFLMEQMTTLCGTISETQAQVEKVNTLRRVENKGKMNEDEQDIFSVDELSWDGNQLKQDKRRHITNEKCQVSLEKSSVKRCQDRPSHSFAVANSPPFNTAFVDEVNNNELCNDDSIKSQASKSSTQQTNNNDIIHSINTDIVHKSNSFHEIKKRFENFNYTNVTTQSQKKDPSVAFIKEDRKQFVKELTNNSRKSKKSFAENDFMLNKFQESVDDCVDNSAFLVSSIGSSTNSISGINLDNNNNKFSDKYKVNNSNVFDRSKMVPSISIDVIADVMSSTNNSTNVNNSRSFQSSYGSKIGRSRKMEHYIEVVQAGAVSPSSEFIQSPSIDSRKSSTSPSDQIMAFDKKHYTRLKKVEKDISDACSPIYNCMKELIDSERTYINGLFILSQVLYTRIKNTDILSPKNFNLLFPNCIQQLFKIHTDFGEQLNEVYQHFFNLEMIKNANNETCEEGQFQTIKFSQIFLETLEKDNWNIFVIYRQYFARVKVALTTFDKLRNQSPKFYRLIKNLQHNEHCKGFDLAVFISLPLKRLPMYLILIRKILEKLPRSQSDERVSILAIEHLLHGFLNEMKIKQDCVSLDKKETRMDNLTMGSSNISPKRTSLNEEVTDEFSNKYNSYETKCETASRKFHGRNDDFNSDSRLHGTKSVKENLNSNKYLSLFNSTRSLDNITKISETSLSPGTRESSEIINNNESNSIIQLRSITNSHNKMKKLIPTTMNNVRPSYVLLKDDICKSMELTKLKEFDTMSVKSQVTDECSVCLNSQDEFEVDTSLEDDDKTYIGATKLKTVTRDESQLSKSHVVPSFSNNSVRYPLIEFCTDASVKCQTFKLPAMKNFQRNSLQQISLNGKPYSIFSSLLSEETDLIIKKKVDNMVKLLCHVIIEICFNDNERSCSMNTEDVHSKHTRSNMKNKLYNAWPDDVTEKCTKASFAVAGEDKSSHKKFSIKHLFSLRRRSRIDQNLTMTQHVQATDQGTDCPAASMISLHKQMSLSPRGINKGSDNNI